jgi:hypothetical protein
MEFNGCGPDAIVWPKPSELADGIDRPLDKVGQRTKIANRFFWSAGIHPSFEIALLSGSIPNACSPIAKV